ncbi:carbonic anhydrase [Glutamicibacter sp.]|uniref:carbonic anhydrase n=1 Tax=Glutamicibacter sp. TaxID=1931995 RepID=UPI0028BECE6D|nr:carbonic anhydrase [Glutamicibacter sp.]
MIFVQRRPIYPLIMRLHDFLRGHLKGPILIFNNNSNSSESKFSELTSQAVGRRRFLAGATGIFALATLTACGAEVAPAAVPAEPTADKTVPGTPEEALNALKEGNARFVAGQMTHPHQNAETREEVAGHQAPWALVHGCVDSRVSPEIVFDQGIGDLFVTRTAGNVLDDTLVGSMEFAVSAPYSVPVLVILGHTACGAVTGTVKALKDDPKNPSLPGEMNDFAQEIAPVARKVAEHGTETEHIDAVVRANTVAVAQGLLKRSAIVRKAVEEGKTKVVAAVYNLETGTVDWEVAA